jgi:L-ribulose-5-phosphate 4-epimerase
MTDQKVLDVVAELRKEVAALHNSLSRLGLVAGTAGNISARLPDAEILVITPASVGYDDITEDDVVVMDLHGEVMDGARAPSVDAASHAFVYLHMPQVGGIVHTHSTYATAWAARNEPVPCVLTAMAGEFGGEIPVGPFALIGDDSIGRGIVETLTDHRSPAVLMRNHGLFALGATARNAVRVAVLGEDAARTVHVARQLGEPVPLSRLHVAVLRAHHQDVYGGTSALVPEASLRGAVVHP